MLGSAAKQRAQTDLGLFKFTFRVQEINGRGKVDDDVQFGYLLGSVAK